MSERQESTDALLSFSYQLPIAPGYFYLKVENEVVTEDYHICSSIKSDCRNMGPIKKIKYLKTYVHILPPKASLVLTSEHAQGVLGDA